MRILLLTAFCLALAGPCLVYSEGKPLDDPQKTPAEYMDALAGPPKGVPGFELIQQWRAVHEPKGAMLDDKNFEHTRKAGMTSIQDYIHWSEVEREPGKFDWSWCDPTVLKAKKQGLKFVPFIIAGPYYSTPKWFRDSDESVYARCLEHDADTLVQSIWNPSLRKHVDRFLKAAAEHYRPMGVLESIELGISGNWGEAIYPATGGFEWPREAHQHFGFWCGDHYARQDFRRWLKAKYHTIDALNREWGTSHANFGEIEPLEGRKAPSAAAVLDLTEWYYDAMNEWTGFWLATARKYFPTEPIYVCTGGDGAPVIGADFAAQAKLAKKHNAGLRITNMGEDFAQNFAVTRLVGSSCRFYDTYFATEEAGFNQRTGVIARIFDLAGCGAKGGYFKTIVRSQDSFLVCDCAPAMVENIGFVHQDNRPVIDVAVLWPNADVALHHSHVRQLENAVKAFRDYLDFDYADEIMIRDGALSRYKFLVLIAGQQLEERAAAKIADWVAKGGVLLYRQPWELVKLPGQPALAERPSLFDGKPHGRGFTARVEFTPEDFGPLSAAIHNQGKSFPWQGLPLLDGKGDGVYVSRVGNRVLRYDSHAVRISESPASDAR